MAHFPDRRNRAVVDAAADTVTPAIPYQDNNAPYAHDDADVTADYATTEEFAGYDDPDSIQDIMRDRPEDFYVGTRDRKSKFVGVVVKPDAQGVHHIVATGNVKLWGFSAYSFSNTVEITGIWDNTKSAGGIVNSQDAGEPVLTSVLGARKDNVMLPYPIECPNGISVARIVNNAGVDYRITVFIERLV